MRLSNLISLFFISVEQYTVESDGSEEEDVVILTADNSRFQQRYDIFCWCNTYSSNTYNTYSSNANIKKITIKQHHVKARVYMNRSEVWSDIKRELLGLKWVGNTTDSWPPSPPPPQKKESARLAGDCLVSIY